MEQNANIVPVNIADEMKTSFLDYSMSVIISRALPDVRDGFKPVHRRILYSMYGLKNFHNRPYLKSARVVGDVIGKYHPHGDSSVYEALVRLAQDFSMRYQVVQGQGNFGSIDGDSAAAMRYTEVRLQSLADELLADLDKDTVDFGPNYDNKDTEPLVMPTKIPYLLVNGASGIAVGMATNIPPHNLTEVLDAVMALIENPQISIDELMHHVKGPDFPTAANIMGINGIRSAYFTGRGSVVMRAVASVEDVPKSNGRERIIVTQLPFQVNKARLLERIAELVRDKKIDGISDLRDESDKDEIRVVIELKKGEPAEILLNNLYKLTPLQTSFGVNMVALVNGTPKLLNLKEVLEQFYLHRRDVVLRRTAYLLRKAEEKGHILEGLKIAVENIDEIVALIRAASDTSEAHKQLVDRFTLSDIQAKAILDMRLGKLTGLERDKIIAEYEEILKVIKDLTDILNSPERVTEIVVTEIQEIREKFGDERRTEILPGTEDDAEFTMESLIADEEVVVTVSDSGYVKRTPLSSISAQKRGGKGRTGMKTKGEDFVKDLFITSNHQSLLCFSNLGRVYDLKVYRTPETNWTGRGKHFANLVKLSADERIVSVLPVREFSEGSFIVSTTKNGYIKKTEMMAYSNLRQNGIIGLKLDDGDELVSCAVTTGKNEILVATKFGKAIRFNEDEIRSMGRASRGVTAIKFGEENDQVIGMVVIDSSSTDSTILSVCENGYGKRTPLEEYRSQSRGGKGIYTIKVTERNGPVVGILQVHNDDQMMIITSSGKVMRFTVSEVGIIGRLTQGVRLMNVDEGEVVKSLARIAQIDGEEVE